MWSIIIPAFNEEERIGATIERVFEYARARNIEIELLVVNDGSIDGTARVAAGHEGIVTLASDINRGKGWAIREGMKHAKGEIVFFTDADMSTPIEEADKLLDALNKGSDVAVGSRMTDTSMMEKYQPWHRVLLGLSFGMVVQTLFSTGIKDTQCGFKMFTSDAAHTLAEHMTINGYTFDVEMLVLAKRMGLKVAEVGVKWHDVAGSKLKVLKDFPQILRELAAIRSRLKKLEHSTGQQTGDKGGK